MRSIRLAIAMAILGALFLLPLHSASAQSDEAFIKYRQKVMQSQGANMGAIADIMKEGLPHKANIAGHALELASSAKLIPTAFEKQVTEGMTDAEAKIWKEKDEFKEYAEKLQKAAANLEKVSMSDGDVGAAVKAVGKACGDCHKEYRKPKEQSYKNKM
jgi:cytochrome c556